MILRRNLLVLGTAAAVMLRTKPGASIIQDGATAIGPAASGSFINVDFINRTSKVIARELFGVSTATMLDFNFALCNNTSFQIASRSLNVPLLRFNCNSGSSGGNVWANLFANGPRGRPDWSVIAPLINNLWKIVDLTKCKIIMGFGGTSGAATDTNGWSVTDFAHALTVVVNHMRTTPGGDGKPINPKYWEIMNEPGISAATYNSYFNACADAVHAIDPTYVVTGPCSPNDAGRVGSLIAATNATRLGLPNWHVYLHCPGIDPVPSNLQIARALTGGAGTDPVGFANGINSLSSGNFTANLPWFCGEYNIGCGPSDTNGREQNILGACFAASWLMKMAATANPVMWAGIWEYGNSGGWGTMSGRNFVIDPQGYFLSQACMAMPGTMVASADVSGFGLETWSTVDGSHLATLIVNPTTTIRSGPVALGHWPINTTGNGTIHLWVISAANPKGVVSTVTVTAGMTASISLPGQSVAILYP